MQIQAAVESCAAGTTDGTYTSCTKEAVAADAPEVVAIFKERVANLTINGAQSYSIGVGTASPDDTSGKGTMFILDHTAKGNTRTCSPSGSDGCAHDGTW